MDGCLMLMNVTIPEIGSRVRVTTLYPNGVAYRGKFDNFVANTREGLVVKSAFNEPFYFAVETDETDHPVLEFNSKSPHVVKVEIL